MNDKKHVQKERKESRSQYGGVMEGGWMDEWMNEWMDE